MSLFPAALFCKQPLLSPVNARSAAFDATDSRTRQKQSSGTHRAVDNRQSSTANRTAANDVAQPTKVGSARSHRSIDTVVAQEIGTILRAAKDMLLETASFTLRRTGLINERQDRAMRDFVNNDLGSAIRRIYIDIPKSFAEVQQAKASGSKAWIIASKIAYRSAQLSIIAYPLTAAYYHAINHLFDQPHKPTATPTAAAEKNASVEASCVAQSRASVPSPSSSSSTATSALALSETPQLIPQA